MHELLNEQIGARPSVLQNPMIQTIDTLKMQDGSHSRLRTLPNGNFDLGRRRCTVLCGHVAIDPCNGIDDSRRGMIDRSKVSLDV